MTPYTLLTIAGVLAGALTARLIRDSRTRGKPDFWFFIAAAFGTVIGAKLPLVATYGFTGELLFTGKSFCGGLAGAFLAVNLCKIFTRRRKAALGGRFVIPLAVAAGVGKIGCWVNGCCGGVNGIPTQLVESAFQFLCAAGFYAYYRKSARLELLFPLYITFYMSMRFMIEFARTEPPVAAGLTIYQFIAILTLPFAVSILLRRRNSHDYEYH